VQAEHVTVLDERVPLVEVTAMRLAGDIAAEPLQIMFDGGIPLFEAACREVAGELAVQASGPPLGAGELGDDRPPDHFEAVAHAGQQPVELVIAQADPAG
jgi:hypothetical protein